MGDNLRDVKYDLLFKDVGLFEGEIGRSRSPNSGKRSSRTSWARAVC
ncbi:MULTISPECIES: hypothetical protein [unclassified Phycicoccus]|nr:MULTISPECIES: hypothetical protein [unclassified Phycicoccus]